MVVLLRLPNDVSSCRPMAGRQGQVVAAMVVLLRLPNDYQVAGLWMVGKVSL